MVTSDESDDAVVAAIGAIGEVDGDAVGDSVHPMQVNRQADRKIALSSQLPIFLPRSHLTRSKVSTWLQVGDPVGSDDVGEAVGSKVVGETVGSEVVGELVGSEVVGD